MSKLNWGKTYCALFLLCAVSAVVAPAQTFTVLGSFPERSDALPVAGFVQATNGDLYGTTFAAHGAAFGTVFKITTGGLLATLFTFDGTDGEQPYPVIQAADGNFYGTTQGGGSNESEPCGIGCGTVFKMSAQGAVTTLYDFCAQTDCTDGFNPFAGLVQAPGGEFYGTTSSGGGSSACGVSGCGTVFKITAKGALTTLHAFEGYDGFDPDGTPVPAADGNLYGTTQLGGNGYGTVFRITQQGVLTTPHLFDGTDGSEPQGLTLGSDGNLYGITTVGGNSACVSGCGTVFKTTPSGDLTTLHSFDGTDGVSPLGTLIQATDGNFYGTTYYGGAYDCGTIFEITPAGSLTTLHNFDGTDGCSLLGALVQATNGVLYGTAATGGAYGYGTVFSLSAGLGPFVETQPSDGKVGAAVKILGTNLAGATSVTFNGTPAAFTVESSSYIKTTVPAGATTGTVQVVTPSGTLSSNVPFRVAP